MTIKAEFVQELDGWRGDVQLYKLSEPVESPSGEMTSHVAVSGIDNEWGTETYIFACDEHRENVDFLEMEGSFRGSIDHEAAIMGAGWVLS
jgi:hypothetical protein